VPTCIALPLSCFRQTKDALFRPRPRWRGPRIQGPAPDGPGRHLRSQGRETQRRWTWRRCLLPCPAGDLALSRAGRYAADRLRERWTVKVEDGPDLDVQGNVVDHEYTIERGGDRVAEVSKRWFRVRDTYGVEIAPGENDILILTTAAVIDTMAHRGR